MNCNLTKLISSFLVIFLNGCATFKFDYVPPEESPTADLIIKSTWNAHNQRIIYHSKEAPCDAKKAKLVGLINGSVIGQKYIKQLEIKIPADQEVFFSLPQTDVVELGSFGVFGTVTFRNCQPIVKFTPSPNKKYTIEFGSCTGDVYEENNTNLIGGLENSCQVTNQNLGEKDKIFLLKDK